MSKFTITLENRSTILFDDDIPEEEKVKGCSTKLLDIWNQNYYSL